MSAWPESVYIINKITYLLDAKNDIDYVGIQNINALNNRIDDLNNEINGSEEKEIEGIKPTLTEIQVLIESLKDQIDGFEILYNRIDEKIDQFNEDLSDANHRIVHICTSSEINTLDPPISDYSVVLIKTN